MYQARFIVDLRGVMGSEHGDIQRLWALLEGGEAAVAEDLVRACLRAGSLADAERAFGSALRAGLGLKTRLSLAARLGWCPRCVWVPAGSFKMGLEERAQNHNIPQPLWMAETAVTQAQWRALMHNNPSKYIGVSARPVEQVSWYEAVAYCQALSERLALKGAYEVTSPRGTPGEVEARPRVSSRWRAPFTAKVTWNSPDKGGVRLPTEAEWEYAASAAGAIGPLDCAHSPWLYDLLQRRGLPSEVYATPRNPFGLYDMLGLVAEWCWDLTDSERTTQARAQRGGRGPRGQFPYPQRQFAMLPSECSDNTGLRFVVDDTTES